MTRQIIIYLGSFYSYVYGSPVAPLVALSTVYKPPKAGKWVLGQCALRTAPRAWLPAGICVGSISYIFHGLSRRTVQGRKLYGVGCSRLERTSAL